MPHLSFLFKSTVRGNGTQQIWQLPTFSVTFTRPFLLKSDPSRPGCSSSSSSSWHLRAATLFLYRNDALHWTYRVPSISASRLLPFFLIVRQKSPTIRASFEGLNRTRPKSRGPATRLSSHPPSPPISNDSTNSHLFSHEPLRKFLHPPRQLSTLFRFRSLPSLSTFIELPLPLHARSDIDLFVFLLSSSASLSSSQCQCCSLRSASINILQFYRAVLASYRRTGRRDRPRRFTRERSLSRCLWNFSFLFGSPYRRGWPVLWNYRSSTANRMDGRTVDDRSSVFRLENIFPWNFARSRSSSSSRDGVAEVTGEKIWGGLGNSALKTWRCLTPRLSETCLRGLYSTYGSLVVYKGVVAL